MPDFVSRDVLRPIRARENISLSWDILCHVAHFDQSHYGVKITFSGKPIKFSKTAISCAE